MKPQPIGYTVQFPSGEVAHIAHEGHLQAGDTFLYDGREWCVTQVEARADGPVVSVVEEAAG